MASSANMEQCSLTGGRHSSLAISVFLIFPACSKVMPRTSSVRYDEEAIAEPQPKVLNLTSEMVWVLGSTLICNFMTSPQAGAPTRPKVAVSNRRCMLSFSRPKLGYSEAGSEIILEITHLYRHPEHPYP